ncbi:MAG: hypothetical protein HC854_13630 [Flavobacterium sp.]|nr:hypothetical protein [Flavobacterium sp.]
MDSFLRKYKLIDTLSFKLNCDKTTFIEKFRANVEPSTLSFSPFEAFSCGSKLYKGNLQNATFKIQKKQQLFNSKQQSPIASAKITEGINDIKIDMEINGVTPFIKIFYIFIAVFYLLFLLGFGFFYFSSSDFPLFVFPLFLFHASFMIGIPFS